MLSEDAKIKRVDCCCLKVCLLKNKVSGCFRSSLDEKIFALDAKMNRYNDYWFVQGPDDALLKAKACPAYLELYLFRRVKASQKRCVRTSFMDGGKALDGECNFRKAVYIPKTT